MNMESILDSSVSSMAPSKSHYVTHRGLQVSWELRIPEGQPFPLRLPHDLLLKNGLIDEVKYASKRRTTLKGRMKKFVNPVEYVPRATGRARTKETSERGINAAITYFSDLDETEEQKEYLQNNGYLCEPRESETWESTCKGPLSPEYDSDREMNKPQKTKKEVIVTDANMSDDSASDYNQSDTTIIARNLKQDESSEENYPLFGTEAERVIKTKSEGSSRSKGSSRH